MLFGLLSMTERLFKSKIFRPGQISNTHLIYISLIDSLKTSTFYSFIYDIGIYTIHELLHHDLTIPNSSLAKVSYMMSCIAFLWVIYGLIDAYTSLYRLPTKKLIKCKELSSKIDKDIIKGNNIEQKIRLFTAKTLFTKEFTYCFGASRVFFLTGIKLENVDSFILKSVKLNSVVKVLIFTLLINSL